MKINKIYIKNINSLYGSWEIDFSEYLGLFAISGATGSGKTSILDAICLALYGQTPRVKNISADKNDLFSIRASECSVAIDFSVNSNSYIAKWAQKRTRKNSKKPFNPAVRSLACEGQIIATGAKEVNDKILEILGMNFVQFTQIVLLAQGQFTAFMRASNSERTQIFANISQNLLYDKISVAVNNRYREEKDKLHQLENFIPQQLEIGEENNWQEELIRLESQQYFVIELQELKLLYDQQYQLITEYEKLIHEKDLFFAQDELRLQNSEKAELLHNIYQIWQQSEQNYIHLDNEIKNTTNEIQDLQKDLESLDYVEIQNKEKKLAIKLEKESLIKEQNYKIKEEISQLEKEIYEIPKEFHQKIDIEGINLNDLKRQYIQALNNKTFIDWNNEYLKAENYKKWLKLQQQIDEKKIALEKAEIAEKERNFAEKTQQFFYLRKELIAGNPCPICGSLEHPIDNLQEALYYDLSAPNECKILQKELFSLEAQLTNKLQQNTSHFEDEINYEQTINCYLNLVQIQKNFYCAQYSCIQEKIDILKQQINPLENDYERSKKEYISIKNLLEKKQESFSQKERKLIELKSIQKIRMQEVDKKNDEMQNYERKFIEGLNENGFISLEVFLQNILDKNEIQKLKDKKQNLLLAVNQNRQQFSTNNNRINVLKDILSIQDLSKIDTELSVRKELEKKRNQKIGSLREKINKLKELEQLQQEKIKQIKEQKIIFANWEQLNELIGVKGENKRFSHFVHGVTFGQMLYFANQQLKMIYPRYQLQRIADELDFNIIDFEQGNNIRSNKNLSGGESFIISLALSLGLAQLSGKNISIDCLFLDEGFGTLDADSLDMVLESLIRIESTGKMIGIISHVGELKERINNIIELIPQSGGFSLMKGKGIKQL